MLKKLRIKFVCINMAIVTIMLVFILCTVVHFTRKNLEQTNIQMMQEIATNPLYLAKPGDISNTRLPYFTLTLDNKGNILETNNYYTLSDRDFFEELITVSSSDSGETGILKDYHLRYMRVTTPSSQFLIFMDISTEMSTIEDLTHNCILIGIFSFFAFLGISIFFANWAIKPVDRAWRQQKQFIADASHELKTPLTVILTNTELLQSPDYDNRQKSTFSENIRIVAKQMQGLVEGLLNLSRIDNGSMKMIMQDFDLSALTENIICLFEPLYFEHELELNTEIDPGIHIRGSESHLREVLDILLDNALKYATSPSRVTVCLKEQKHSCILSVQSVGETMTETDLKNIFRRFYRIDKCRNRSGSYGLGLSIAESIIKEHHGKIWAESRGGVNTFFVRLGCLHFHSNE